MHLLKERWSNWSGQRWIWVWPHLKLCLFYFILILFNPDNDFIVIVAELSHLELQPWGCDVLLSHMACSHTCQCVKHSYCMPSGAVWHPFPANYLARGTDAGICCYSIPAGNNPLRRSSKTLPFSISSSYNHPKMSHSELISINIIHSTPFWTQEVGEAWSRWAEHDRREYLSVICE